MIRNRIEFDENWKGQPADLKHLRRLVQLESITITGDTVTEMVFDDLVDLPKLVRVELQNVKFSDQSLAKLGSMKSVESLYIWYSPFTDKALPHLMNLKRAKHIQLWGTDMTESSVEKLRQAYLGIDLIFHRGALLGIESDQEPVDSGGCRVVRVTEGTAAATAGIRPGDTIISVDDTKIESFDVLKATMAKKKHGETVTIRIRRRDKELDLKTKLGEWSPALRPPFR